MDNNSNQRRSIWDMNVQDTTIYLIVFIVFMLPGMVYNLWYRFAYQPGADLDQISLYIPDRISLYIEDIGKIGFSAAVATFVIIVIRRGVMALIDWPSKEKYRSEGRIEGLTEGIEVGRSEGISEGIEVGRSETQREWALWNERRIAAERRGDKFDEPPPGA